MRIAALAAAVSLAALATQSAIAADLPVRAPAPAPVAAPYFTWTGLYVGVQGGYAWAKHRIVDENITTGVTDYADRLKGHGWVGGAHVGYNHQYANNIVIGLEADAEFAGIRVRNPLWPWGDFSKMEIDAQGSLRARLGYAFGRVLPYVTGGVAIANIKSTFVDAPAVDRHTTTKTALTVGAGLEYAFANNWSARVEYRYTANRKTTTNTATTDSGWLEHERISDQTVRVGLSYKFGGPSAVVAKY